MFRRACSDRLERFGQDWLVTMLVLLQSRFMITCELYRYDTAVNDSVCI